MPLGLGGAYSGLVGDTLLVAGGTFFSAPPWSGGAKQWDGRVFALAPGAGGWESLGRLEPPLAYGASITTPRGVVMAGGGDARQHFDTVRLLTLVNGRVHFATLPPLSRTAAYLEGTRLGNTLYVAGGRSAPDAPRAMRSFLALDLDRLGDRWRELEPWPGPARIFPRVVGQDGAVYVFSGAELVPGKDGWSERRYLTDAYRYRPGQGWSRIADLPHAVVAAPVVAWGDRQILVFGGDDGRLAAQGVALGDDHPGFRREVLVYDTGADQWAVVQGLPSLAVTTSASLSGRTVLIPTGEDRPGHRTTTVLAIRPSGW
ncbi:MAG TPA: galactose oxidase [Phycisphaerae bacterium]|nr:galactose oxidase [Phycisphaerae bacterium]HRY70980.1 galactose oxidase [Phycisphaerae bacterium]